MTDYTSPVAKLAAGLPKGNGLARAVPVLFEQRGTLVPFVGLMRVEETGLDADDVQHLKGSIARFELCLGALEHDGKGLLARATTAANEYAGQQTLFAEPGSEEQEQEKRDELLGYLREWQAEQTPPLTDDEAADRWNSFHGGFYDARPEAAKAIHLREFLMSIGALADSPTVDGPALADGEEEVDLDDDDTTPDADDDDDTEQPAAPTLASVPFQQPHA